MERIISELEMPNEVEIQKSLRPKSFDEYIGQENLKEKMNISIKAAQKRNMVVDHILLYGPPGLGKTTLAGVIANEMKANLKITSGPILEKAGDLAAILTSLEENDILFIDEIHRLNSTVEEILYPAMEDGELDIIIGKGPSAKSIRIELPPFTLIGATTRAGLLSAPLRDRFGVSHKMEYYNENEIKSIIIRGAKILGVKIDEDGAIEISKRSRGTPRIANRLLKRVRDYCEIKGNGTIDKLSAKNALDMLGVDGNGLDDLDRNIINSIIENYDGGPVGIETLSLLLGEDRRTLEEVYEPYLVKIGFLKRVRDYCEIKGNGTIDKLSAKSALDMLGVDSNGLDDLDRNIVNSIIENYDGGPVGIETLSLLLGEDRRTLEEVYEPYLVKIGFLKRTNRGRVVTPKAYQHFKKDEVKDEDKHKG